MRRKLTPRYTRTLSTSERTSSSGRKSLSPGVHQPRGSASGVIGFVEIVTWRESHGGKSAEQLKFSLSHICTAPPPKKKKKTDSTEDSDGDETPPN